MASDPRRSLHRMAWAGLVGAFLLVLAGGLVTSRDAGLAVPDWPLAFGSLNPPGWWQMENVRTEHSHRILAFLVASWTGFLLLVVLRRETSVLVRRFAITAAALVIVQALLGGLRVLELSVDLAMIHGVVGQLFLASLAAVVAVTSPSWERASAVPETRRERVQSAVLLGAVAAQLLLGLFIRHLGPSARPLSGTPLLYAHVIGAGVVLCALLDLQRDCGARCAPGGRLLLPLVSLQIALGIAAYVTTDDMTFDRQATILEAWLPTLHVGAGAALLATVVVRNLHAWRSVLVDTASAPHGAFGRVL
ncbi:MAG TPA: COX15/CtaA family protein [Candidatus Limnocylindrales bacterium]|nr:COX15/CtaA family protein [Candidatus Limnocylindrales bacterium]